MRAVRGPSAGEVWCNKWQFKGCYSWFIRRVDSGQPLHNSLAPGIASRADLLGHKSFV